MSIKKIQILTPIVTSVNGKNGDVVINVGNLGIEEELAKKSDVNHTHKYAGSDEPGGAATSANKLTKDAGSENKPVYFKNGVPVALPYTIDKSVPADAIFTDTTYGIGNNTAAGVAKLYDSVGPNSDGAMTQNATQALFDGKATTSKTVPVTLLASGWSGNAAPYTYNLSVTGVTAFSNQEIIPAANITRDQLISLQGTNMIDGGQSNGKIILKATKNKPTVDIPMRVILRGDAVQPVKGDLLNMDLDGNGDKQYRVLKINGSKAMVLGMSDISTSQAYNTTSKTGTFNNGTTGQLYAGSDLDTYLNTTWYNTLTAAAKAAIVPESRTQYIYQYYDIPNTPNTPTYTYQYQFNWNDSDYENANLTDSILVGNRNVFALDLKDIFDYFGKACITSNELMEVWTNQTSIVNKQWWLSSASDSVTSWIIGGDRGILNEGNIRNGYVVRPAFTIDLSKIPFTKV